MNTAKQELLERKRLSQIIRLWAGQNKKTFWKYEVSSFYKTYIIRVANLPNPSKEDILISSNKKLLNNQQKTELCNAIKKSNSKTEMLSDSSIDVRINYVSDDVTAELV